MELMRDPTAKVQAHWKKLLAACRRAQRSGHELIRLLEAEERKRAAEGVDQPGCRGGCGYDAGRRSGYCFDCPHR
jgi:hypothetical protein